MYLRDITSKTLAITGGIILLLSAGCALVFIIAILVLGVLNGDIWFWAIKGVSYYIGRVFLIGVSLFLLGYFIRPL